jgi:hypothetical protein
MEELIRHLPQSRDINDNPVSPRSSAESDRCVQNRHIMSAYRLEHCLIILGWTAAELARRSGEHRTTVQRWRQCGGVKDPDIVEWLETLVAFHLAHPCPRRRRIPAFLDVSETVTG